MASNEAFSKYQFQKVSEELLAKSASQTTLQKLSKEMSSGYNQKYRNFHGKSICNHIIVGMMGLTLFTAGT